MLAFVRFVGIEPKTIFDNLLNVGFDPIKMKLREQRGGSAASFGATGPQAFCGARRHFD